jgi:hypothetical protein
MEPDIFDVLKEYQKKTPRAGRKSKPAQDTSSRSSRVIPAGEVDPHNLGEAAPTRSGARPNRATTGRNGDRPNRYCKRASEIVVASRQSEPRQSLPFDEYTVATPCKDLSNPRTI